MRARIVRLKVERKTGWCDERGALVRGRAGVVLVLGGGVRSGEPGGGHGLRLVGVEAGGDSWTEGNEENEVEWLIGVWLSGKGDGWGG